jgi:hypothetical protein
MMHNAWRHMVGLRVTARYEDTAITGTLGRPRWPVVSDGKTTTWIESDPRWVLTPVEAPKAKAKRRTAHD